MTAKTMSLIARRELQASIRRKYRYSSWTDKRKILDGFVAATGYERKYAIQLLKVTKCLSCPRTVRHRSCMMNKYGKL
ncbi:hypothetical protein [Nitrosomonas sp.]|uniref:hypothetical protein n=1 Tax=Nitrosomonas sp. TaxID=42353 RepID=UPI0025D8B8B0|nr:hypothetical protein [Nitrosomonas sp.]